MQFSKKYNDKKHKILGVLYSAAFHLVVLLLCVVGLPHMNHNSKTDYVITMDLVQLSDITNIKIKKSISNISKNDPDINKDKEIVQKKEEISNDQNAEAAQLKAQQLQNIKKPEEKLDIEKNKNNKKNVSTNDEKEEILPDKNKKPDQKSDEKLKEKANEKVNENKEKPNQKQIKNNNKIKEEESKVKIDQKNTKNKKNTDSWEEIMKSIEDIDKNNKKDIDKQKNNQNKKEAPKNKQNNVNATKDSNNNNADNADNADSQDDIENAISGETNMDYNNNIRMSMTELDAIRSQIHWNKTSFGFAAVEGHETMKVTLHITLAQDGSVLTVKPIKYFMDKNNSIYQAFIDSTIRAVHIASPLKGLSHEKYNIWNEMNFTFGPDGIIH